LGEVQKSGVSRDAAGQGCVFLMDGKTPAKPMAQFDLDDGFRRVLNTGIRVSGVSTMPEYRAYIIGPDGHIQQRFDLPATRELEAREQAKRLVEATTLSFGKARGSWPGFIIPTELG
jgi:hypothetical protein